MSDSQPPSSTLLDVRDLEVVFTRKGRRDVRAVDGVSFAVDNGETVGLVGESGSGKSVTSLAVMGLLPDRGVRVGGQVWFDGDDLLTLPKDRMRDIRGQDIAMVFQDPMSSLNPVVPIGIQVTEVLTRHQGLKGEVASAAAVDLLNRVGIPDPNRRLKEYPHQLSGGMRQRALIAMALACRPRVLIADEPTTALDVTIQAQILELLKELVRDSDAALVMITHDLGVIAGLCDAVHVMYGAEWWSRPDGASCSLTLVIPTPAGCSHPCHDWIRPAVRRCIRSRGRRRTAALVAGMRVLAPVWQSDRPVHRDSAGA